MALVLADRVLETCTSPGTGAVSLLGATTGYQAFSAAIGDGNTCYYCIADQGGANWEVGVGTYASSGNTLTRTTPLSGSAATPVDFTSGTQNVFVTYPAEKSVNLNAAGNVSALGTVSSGTWQGTAIVDTYLATISTAGKVSNSATTATDANTVSAIVARDASGNFSAGTITATLNGSATSAGSVAHALTMNNAGSGETSGATFDGSAAKTISYNTIGAQPTLVSGTNIKTVSGTTLLGSGDLGTIGIAYGGTGATTAADAINALLPSQATNTGKFLTTNGSVASWADVSGVSQAKATGINFIFSI